MRISDWSSDVCSSDLSRPPAHRHELAVHPDFDEDVGVQGLDGHFGRTGAAAPILGNRAVRFVPAERPVGGSGGQGAGLPRGGDDLVEVHATPSKRGCPARTFRTIRSEEHTSELQSLMSISYAVS